MNAEIIQHALPGSPLALAQRRQGRARVALVLVLCLLVSGWIGAEHRHDGVADLGDCYTCHFSSGAALPSQPAPTPSLAAAFGEHSPLAVRLPASARFLLPPPRGPPTAA